ncbi:hypothetical protein SOVF_186710 [Spinacia oleracea]|nr:hypothetical protein SOVF_186710 [Spinacia oleracea]
MSLWSTLLNSKSYTLNFDGSHNNQANKSGAGCVIWDNQSGDFVIAASYNLTESYPDYCNVAIAEAVALRNGLQLARDRNLNVTVIEGDSTEVIDHVLGRSRRPPSTPPLNGIIRQIVGMVNRVSQKVVIVDREANQVADKLAYLGCNKVEDGGYNVFMNFTSLPLQVADLIRKQKRNPFSSRTEKNDGEGSSVVEKIGMAGAAVAGVAMLAWGVSNIMFGESSSNHHQQQQQQQQQQQEAKNKAKVPQMLARFKSPEKIEHFILHYSGSDINQLQNGGAGCIIRNGQGKFVTAETYNLDHLFTGPGQPGQYNVAIGEAIGWRNGLRLAKAKNIRLSLIIGDNKEVIDRVRGLERRAPKVALLNEIIGEIREGLIELRIDPMNQVRLIGREDNKVANELAFRGSKLGYGQESCYASGEVLPFKLAHLITQEEIDWPDFVI